MTITDRIALITQAIADLEAQLRTLKALQQTTLQQTAQKQKEGR